jgi:hypothetical protein
VGNRSGRYVAGLSSGGGGAMKYAAAHPGTFGAAGEFSGAVDTDLDYPQYPTISEALWLITLIPGYGPDGHCTWGDPYSQRVIWLDNTARPLAENLKGTALFLATGNGDAGPYDSGPNWDPTEYEVGQMNLRLADALDAAGIPHTDEFYGPGSHTWPYWKRDLAHFLDWLKPKLGKRVDAPASFSMRLSRAAFSAWGWDFKAARDVREFTYLRDVGEGGFTVTGSGGLNVVTAALFKRGHKYAVSYGEDSVGEKADRDGRLHLHVDLGPSHQVQQYRFGANATKNWRKVKVRIAR